MKKLISKLLPAPFRSSFCAYRSNKQRVLELKNMLNWNFRSLLATDDDSDSILKRILLRYHVIEKGLTMPERRNGFGKEVLMGLISDIKLYIEKYGETNEQIHVAIGVVAEYLRVHEEQGGELDNNVMSLIKSFLSEHHSPATRQKEMDKDEYFSANDKPFDVFSQSRHSLRHFEGVVDNEKLDQAFQLAQNAPSACNRQATRVRVISDKEIITKIFSIQRGNRGFGHLADKLLVLTTDMRYWEIKTCFGGYVDTGIYAMNLLYSLHFHEIGACPLNACFTPAEEKEIRKIIGLPDYENLVLFIAIGGVPRRFSLANAHRYNANTIVKYL